MFFERKKVKPSKKRLINYFDYIIKLGLILKIPVDGFVMISAKWLRCSFHNFTALEIL